MNRLDALITMQKTPALCEVPFLNKSRKTEKNYHFPKNANTPKKHLGINYIPNVLKNGRISHPPHPYLEILSDLIMAGLKDL